MRFKSLFVVALACSVVGIAWFAASELVQTERAAIETVEASCDDTLDQHATAAWLAGAFDLSGVPGDTATPPLERMLADDRDVFVPPYPAGSYEAQIKAIREATCWFCGESRGSR